MVLEFGVSLYENISSGEFPNIELSEETNKEKEKKENSDKKEKTFTSINSLSKYNLSSYFSHLFLFGRRTLAENQYLAEIPVPPPDQL